MLYVYPVHTASPWPLDTPGVVSARHSPEPEPAMHVALRQTYHPKPDHTPRWLRRLWLWF